MYDPLELRSCFMTFPYFMLGERMCTCHFPCFEVRGQSDMFKTLFFFPSTVWVLEVKFSSSRLAASIFTWWTLLPAHMPLSLKFRPGGDTEMGTRRRRGIHAPHSFKLWSCCCFTHSDPFLSRVFLFLTHASYTWFCLLLCPFWIIS